MPARVDTIPVQLPDVLNEFQRLGYMLFRIAIGCPEPTVMVDSTTYLSTLFHRLANVGEIFDRHFDNMSFDDQVRPNILQKLCRRGPDNNPLILLPPSVTWMLLSGTKITAISSPV